MNEALTKVKGTKTKAFKAAFPYTLPIMAGFLFLGIAYGVYMRSLGFSFLYPMFMSMLIFAGSSEFVVATLLLSNFNPLYAFLLTVMINARHLFYGISMLEKYDVKGVKKLYLIFGLCDETFSINCSVTPPENVNKDWFMFFITLLNHIYWIAGATLGGVLGGLISFDIKGLDFVMTALFVVIFLDRFMSRKVHLPAIAGIVISAVCLVVLGADNFIIPALLLILLFLTLCRSKLDLPEEMLRKDGKTK